MDQELVSPKAKPDAKQVKGNAVDSPDDFLLRKEVELGHPISPRFRDLFYRKLKTVNTRNYAEIWRSMYGD